MIMQNQVIVTTSKDPAATMLGATGTISNIIGGADHSGFDGDPVSHQLIKSEVGDFMFTQTHHGVAEPGENAATLQFQENHASVVPESEDKHSDTTQQNIQMLKDQLEKPVEAKQYVALTAP